MRAARACRHQSLIISNVVMMYLVAERVPSFLEVWRNRVVRGGWWRADSADEIAWVVVFALSWFLVPLYSSHMIPEEDGKVYSGGSCWADLPIHMHIAYSFLSGRNQDVSWGDMHSPVFAGACTPRP